MSGQVPGKDGPVVVRAIIQQSDGRFVPGEWGNSSWPQVVIRGKAMGPDNLVEVPLGETTITVGKGPDYFPQTVVTNLAEAGRTYHVQVELEPVVDLVGKGWRAGDAHIHFFHGDAQVFRSPEEAFRICAAGGLNFASMAGEHFGAPNLTRAEVLQTWKAYDGSECQMWLGTEAPKSAWGHHVGIAYDPWAVQEHLPYSVGIHEVHAQGGVSFPVHPDRLYPVRESEGSYTMYPLNNHLKYLPISALAGHLLDGWSGISDEPDGPGKLDTYFKLLEMGYKIPLLTDSDYCMDRVNNGLKGAGFWINYVHLEGNPLSRASVSEAIRRGRVMATTGPLVLFTIDGELPGSSLPADGRERMLRIEASYHFNPWTLSYSNFDGTERCQLSRVQLLRNGKVVREWETDEPTLVIEEPLAGETERCHYMVRAYGNDGIWMTGYASPIYFEEKPAPRQPPVFKPLAVGRLYDARTGSPLSGTVSAVRYGKTEWTIPTDSEGRFQARMPIDAELVARDKMGRELSRSLLSHEQVYAFCHYLPERYSTNKPRAIDDFMGMVDGMMWEFPMGWQNACSYVRTNLASDGRFEAAEVLEAPERLEGKEHTEIVMVLVDKTRAAPGDTIHYAAIFRSPNGNPPTERLHVLWSGWDTNYPRMYTRRGKYISETREREELVALGDGFYMRTNSMVVPDWVTDLNPGNGGLSCRVTVSGATALEDVQLVIPVGPAKRELLVSTTWDGIPATWEGRGIGPGNFNRENSWRVRYPDYREMAMKVTVNGEEIEIRPKADTAHVADADDAILEDFFYYDGQCEPEYRDIPFRDPVREQPAGPSFEKVPTYLGFPDRGAPAVVAMEPMDGAVVESPVRVYYHVADAGLSGAAKVDILLNGERVLTNMTEVPVVLELKAGDYTWQVEGWDRAGNRALSAEKQFTVVEERVQPEAVVLTDVGNAEGGFEFSFSATAGLNYLVEQSVKGANWDFLLRTNASTNVVRVVDPAGLEGKGRLFRVRAGE